MEASSSLHAFIWRLSCQSWLSGISSCLLCHVFIMLKETVCFPINDIHTQHKQNFKSESCVEVLFSTLLVNTSRWCWLYLLKLPLQVHEHTLSSIAVINNQCLRCDFSYHMPKLFCAFHMLKLFHFFKCQILCLTNENYLYTHIYLFLLHLLLWNAHTLCNS